MLRRIRRRNILMEMGFASSVAGGLIASGIAVLLFRVSFLAGAVLLCVGILLGLLCVEYVSKYDAELNL